MRYLNSSRTSICQDLCNDGDTESKVPRTIFLKTLEVLLEGLVDGSKPTNVGARSEHYEPDDGQPKVGHSTSTKHPSKAANEIYCQCSTVHCKKQQREASVKGMKQESKQTKSHASCKLR